MVRAPPRLPVSRLLKTAGAGGGACWRDIFLRVIQCVYNVLDLPTGLPFGKNILPPPLPRVSCTFRLTHGICPTASSKHPTRYLRMVSRSTIVWTENSFHRILQWHPRNVLCILQYFMAPTIRSLLRLSTGRRLQHCVRRARISGVRGPTYARDVCLICIMLSIRLGGRNNSPGTVDSIT